MSLRFISRNAAIIGGGLLASRVLAFVREALLARYFGLSARMDALVVALSIADFSVNLLLGGAAATVLLPGLSLAFQEGGEAKFWELARVLLRWLFFALVAMAGVVALAAPWLVAWTAPGMSADTRDLATQLLRIAAVSMVFAGGALAYTSLLQARERFALPALAAALQNATVVGVILLLGRRLTAWAVASGVVLGAAGRNLLLRTAALRRSPARDAAWRQAAAHWLQHREAQAMLADFLPAAMAFSFIYLNAFIDRFYASRLGAGGIAALNYADKLTQVPLAVLGSAVSIAIIPVLTRQMQEHRLDRVRRDVGWSLTASTGLATLLAAAVICLRLPLINLLFGHGRLSPRGMALASTALLFYALTIVPETGSMILLRVFHAQRNVWTPAWITLATLAAHAGLAAILAPRWGMRGIGTALAGTSCLYLIVIGTLAWKRIAGDVLELPAAGGGA